MTEHEWCTASNPNVMLAFLESQASERKLRLFAIACCRRALGYFETPVGLYILNSTEQYAAGLISWADLWTRTITLLSPTIQYGYPMIVPSPFWARLPTIIHYGQFRKFVQLANELADRMREAVNDNHAALNARPGEEVETARAAWHLANYGKQLELLLQCFTLRELFGNPFRPVGENSFGVNDKAYLIASQIYETAAFNRLCILADALEDAGCDNADIVNHCRQPGGHVRGCWVVDLLLGKK